MKTCDWCHVYKPLTQFWRAVRAQDGRQRICIDCHNLRGADVSTARRVPTTRTEPPRTRTSPYALVDRDILRPLLALPSLSPEAADLVRSARRRLQLDG